MSATATAYGPAELAFLAGGGEMGRRMRELDWSRHCLGPPNYWPQSLKTIVRVLLDCRYAMWMAWGPELTFFCNDAYLPTVGLKRDWVLGARSDQVWKEIWPDIGPRIAHVLASGQATWDEGLLLFLERSGFTEETYHTFSYSPVYDDHSRIAGMLCVVTEVTERVIGERRLRVLRDLAARSIGAETVTACCQQAMEVLAQHPLDLPFMALYLLDEEGAQARLRAVSRTLPEEWFPATLPLTLQRNPWKLAELRAEGLRQHIGGLVEEGLKVSAGPWSDPVQQAVALPLKSLGQERTVGFMLAGVSPRRAFDDAYGSFLELVASQVASAIANAQAYEAERERAIALTELDRAKTTFFSNVSHEFRTPLTLMLGPLDDLLRDAPLPAEVRGKLDVVHRNALRLLKLVNSLLEFSRIEAGRIQARFEATDLSMLTRELVSTFASTFEMAGLRLKQHFEELDEPVFVDRDMWERVVLNLLSNAFKYTLQGEIEVTLARRKSEVELTVRDTGIGIPPEALPRLFDRFYRVEGAQGRTHEGSGIGLALVAELVRLHSGTVAVESELGRGTTLRIRLALGNGHLPAAQIATSGPPPAATAAARAYVQEAMRWLPDSAGTHRLPLSESLEDAPSVSLPGLRAAAGRVLVADDNADMRAYVRGLLESSYEVVAVPDGEAALAAASRSIPDLIVSDVMMPRMDGFELLRRLRADPALRGVPTILLSARAGEESVIEGLEAMADDYLVKPFSARELLARVGAQLQLSRLRRAASTREHALRQRAEVLLHDAPMGVYVVDADFRICDANAAARLLFGAIPEVIGQDFAAVMHILWRTSDAEQIIGLFRRTLETGEAHAAPQHVVERRDRGVTEYYEWQISRIPLADGRHGVVCYFRDISAQVHSRIALEAADRHKNEFLAMLAHELRNPLAPIRNAGEILTRTLPAESSAHAAIGMIKRQVAQLTRLVDDLLDVSRITQGRIELKREPLDLADIVHQALETAEPLFRERQHEVSITSSLQALHVNGDMTRLVQSFVNVLTNSAKYTDPGGAIRVQTRADGSNALLEVSDNGAGICAELLPRVFELFVQGDRTLDRSLGGLGIGLSVAKQLVEMHGGRITASSGGLGSGSTFRIWLPLIDPPVRLLRDESVVRCAPARVLIVDDNADAADSLVLVLKLDGHIAESAYSAKSALEKVGPFGPDIVLLDIGLPEMDGYEVARQIRALPGLESVRLVALTGYGQSEDLRRARDAGFDDHLVKPVDLAMLERCLSGASSGTFARRPA